jgi:hypothetical protein
MSRGPPRKRDVIVPPVGDDIVNKDHDGDSSRISAKLDRTCDSRIVPLDLVDRVKSVCDQVTNESPLRITKQRRGPRRGNWA